MLLSTRGGAPVTASGAILAGLAPDGGLYVPEHFPSFSPAALTALCPMSYAERADRILQALLDDFTPEETAQAAQAAYGARFENSRPAPLRALGGGRYLLELYHGPTLAFKDMALQILPHLLALSARKQGMHKEICILVATSGDTGKAALEGFCDVAGTRCAVFYPRDGVSRAQQLQMVTQSGNNTHVIAVEGNFDDAQTGVKRIFADEAFARLLDGQHRVLTSANSINFGRLAPQVAYYFSAYADLLAQGAITPGDPVHFAVPTGNFGNILAAAYARRMGLPVGKLLCASNANRVLADFIQTGEYDANRPFHKTLSPSMDILISSNLERYLFELCGRDAAQVRSWMDALRRTGRYRVDGACLRTLQQEMEGGWVDDAQAQAEIRQMLEETGALIDPHTAVAAALMRRYQDRTGDRTPVVVVSTASPFKFGRAVADALGLDGVDDFACCRALSERTGLPVPAQIAALETLPVRHTLRCAPEEMKNMLLKAFQGAR